MTDNKSPADRLLELMVFGPTGLAVTLVEEFPKFVEKGRHRVEGQVHTARLLGQFAVQMGRRQLEQSLAHFGGAPDGSTARRQRVLRHRVPRRCRAPRHRARRHRARRHRAPRLRAPRRRGPGARRRPWRCVPEPARRRQRGRRIPGDAHRAVGVAERRRPQRELVRLVARHPRVRQPVGIPGGPAARGLSSSELEEVRAHEAAHRQRRTILHRVEQLLAGDVGPALDRVRHRIEAVGGGHAAGHPGGRRSVRRVVPRGARGAAARGGGPLFVRRETGLIAKALMRPGGLDRLLADPRRTTLLGTVDGVVVGLALGGSTRWGRPASGSSTPATWRAAPAGWGWVGLLEGLVTWFEAAGVAGSTSTCCPVTGPPRTSSRRRGSRPGLSLCTAPSRDRHRRRGTGRCARGGGGWRRRGDGALLLVQRGTEPHAGRWSVPGGTSSRGRHWPTRSSESCWKRRGWPCDAKVCSGTRSAWDRAITSSSSTSPRPSPTTVLIRRRSTRIALLALAGATLDGVDHAAPMTAMLRYRRIVRRSSPGSFHCALLRPAPNRSSSRIRRSASMPPGANSSRYSNQR